MKTIKRTPELVELLTSPTSSAFNSMSLNQIIDFVKDATLKWEYRVGPKGERTFMAEIDQGNQLLPQYVSVGVNPVDGLDATKYIVLTNGKDLLSSYKSDGHYFIHTQPIGKLFEKIEMEYKKECYNSKQFTQYYELYPN